MDSHLPQTKPVMSGKQAFDMLYPGHGTTLHSGSIRQFVATADRNRDFYERLSKRVEDEKEDWIFTPSSTSFGSANPVNEFPGIMQPRVRAGMQGPAKAGDQRGLARLNVELNDLSEENKMLMNLREHSISLIAHHKAAAKLAIDTLEGKDELIRSLEARLNMSKKSIGTHTIHEQVAENLEQKLEASEAEVAELKAVLDDSDKAHAVTQAELARAKEQLQERPNQVTIKQIELSKAYKELFRIRTARQSLETVTAELKTFFNNMKTDLTNKQKEINSLNAELSTLKLENKALKTIKTPQPQTIESVAAFLLEDARKRKQRTVTCADEAEDATMMVKRGV